MGLYPQIGATSVYVPTSLVGTVNFYVHPGTLYLTSTKELNPEESHNVTTGNIAEKLTMYPRVWPNQVLELNIPAGVSDLVWYNSGYRRTIGFSARDKTLIGGYTTYNASYKYEGTKIIVDSAPEVDKGSFTYAGYFSCPILRRVNYTGPSSKITITSRVSLTGMLEASGYNSNMLEGICTWVLERKPPTIGLSLYPRTITLKGGVEDMYGETTLSISTEMNGYDSMVQLSTDSSPEVTFATSQGSYTDELNDKFNASASDYKVKFKVKPGTPGEHVYVVNFRVTLV